MGAERRASLQRGARAIALGGAVGFAIAGLAATAPWPDLADLLREVNARVGPVWAPMLGVALRVSWLAGRAFATRFGGVGLATPVRPELLQLAPLFAALGLAGTVWGLTRAFDALDQGEFLARLPVLLGGLGAAMTSTLVGLALQIATLLLAAFNPTWSTARVDVRGAGLHFTLDGRPLGEGMGELARTLDVRRPEALHLVFADGIADDARARVAREVWARVDGALPIRVARA